MMKSSLGCREQLLPAFFSFLLWDLPQQIIVLRILTWHRFYISCPLWYNTPVYPRWEAALWTPGATWGSVSFSGTGSVAGDWSGITEDNTLHESAVVHSKHHSDATLTWLALSAFILNQSWSLHVFFLRITSFLCLRLVERSEFERWQLRLAPHLPWFPWSCMVCLKINK